MTEARHVIRPPRRTEATLLALLEEVARAANEADSVEEAGRVTLTAVCHMTGWPAGHLCLPALDTPGTFISSGIWALPAGVDFPELRRVSERTRFAPGRGLVGSVLATRQPAWSQDVARNAALVRDAPGSELGIGAAFAFPVPARDGIAAVLEFFSRRALPPDPPLLRVMATIGTQLGRVADRVQARRQLEAGSRRLEQIIETSAEAFVAMDDTGMITAWNAAAEQLFGLPRELVIGQSLVETIIPPRLRDEHSAAVARFLATGEQRVVGRRIETAAWRPADGEFPVELAIWAVLDGRRWTFHGFLHDIRERRRGEQALREEYESERAAAAALRALDQAKDDFVATVSHELRTPLTSLSGYLELLLDGDAGPMPLHQERMLRTMARNTSRLRALVEDLLLISQMDAGSLQLRLEPTDLAALVLRAVRSLSPVARAREQRFDVELQETIGAVPADSTHLDRAVRALLSNAIKFSPDGGLVTVRGTKRPGHIELSVIDRGVGIDDDDVQRLFERFYRTGQATAGAVQGAGLGLTIARRIIEEHGGSIAVASTPGEGSIFTVTLPAL
jgi:PAS domain S-box-containing protein